MTNLKIALFNALLRKEPVCCLCFSTIDYSSIHTGDEVVLKTNNDTRHLELYEVLTYVLGNEVSNNLAFNTVCNQCAVTALNCYTFIKTCKQNSQDLQKAVQNIDNCLPKKTEQPQYLKSLFVSLDANLIAQEFYDFKRPVQSPSAILKRYKTLSNGLYDKCFVPPVKNDENFDADIDVDSEQLENNKHINKKLKKARPRTSLPKELILDKDSTPLAYKCNGCLKVFQTIGYLRQHYLRLHVPKTFKCPQCDRCYASYSLVEQHLKDSHRTTVCVECGKTYSRTSLKQHELSHRWRLTCQSCGRVYKNKDTFSQHIKFGICGQTSRKSAIEGLFKCDMCNKQYSRKASLRVHIKLEHSNTGQLHFCSWCNKKFSCQSRLREHAVKHTQEKNFPCDICGGKFVTKTSLLYHTRIHTGEKPYNCSFCDQRFLSSSRRAEHVRRHHKEPSLPCDICKAKFRNHSCLLRHKQRHANPKSRLFHDKADDEENLMIARK